MQTNAFAEIVLTDETAREQDDGAVDPHGPCLAKCDGSLRSALDEIGKWAAARQKRDDADEQNDGKETDGVVEHIGYGRRGGEFRSVEWNAVWTKQNGTG